jgi:hypothetical protein
VGNSKAKRKFGREIFLAERRRRRRRVGCELERRQFVPEDSINV